MRALVLLSAILLFCMAACTVLAQAVPDAITYQGKLTDASGQPVPDGTYSVQFKLYTVLTGGIAFWSSAAANVQTTGGVFTTTLQSLDPADLQGKTNVYMETIVEKEALSPRVKVVSTPFALRAGDLDLPYEGSVESYDTAFSVMQTGGGRAGLFRIDNSGNNMSALQGISDGSGSAVYGYMSGDGEGLTGLASGAGDAVHGVATGTGRAGYFEIANPSPANAVEVSTVGAGDSLYATTSGGGAAVHGVNTHTGRAGLFQITTSANSTAALTATTIGSGNAFYATSTGSGDVIAGNTSGTGSAGKFTLTNSASTADAVTISTNSTSSGGDGLYVSTSGAGNALYAYSTGSNRAGYFQIDNAGSSADALFAHSNAGGDAFQATSSGSGNAVHGYMSGGGKAGYFRIANPASTEAALFAETNATSVTSAFSIYGIHTSSGNFGYIGSGQYGVYGDASGTSDSGVYGVASANNGYGVYGSATYSAAGSTNYGVRGEAAGDYGRGGYFRSSGPYGRGIQASATNAGNYVNYGGHFTASGILGIGIYARGGTSGKAAVLRGNVELQDHATGATVMELGTGLDYAEGFDVTRPEHIAPGSVLVIDAKNPGKLTLSRKPYDRCVAGIVAGARNLGSGVRLGAGQFDRDVALAGRVYCNVDATEAAVEPGDLLTTSSTPGYAMKVTDHSRAQGAILGKAMESLARGQKGQIMVLVTLQ